MKKPAPSFRFSAHIGFLFGELPFAERFAAASNVGFTAVEHPSPFHIPVEQVADLLEDNDLEFVQTGFPAGDPARGEKGFAALRDRRADFRDAIAPTLDYASRIGCHMLHAMAGIVPAGAPRQAMWDEYLENLGFAADAARAYDIDIIIEPIGPGSITNYFIDQPQLALDAIKALARPNVRLLFDVFHAVSLGTEPLAFIAAHSRLIGHLQIADFPGRHEPGSAVIDFAKVFAAVSQAGFAGHIGCEYHPSERTIDSFGWMREWIGERQ